MKNLSQVLLEKVSYINTEDSRLNIPTGNDWENSLGANISTSRYPVSITKGGALYMKEGSLYVNNPEPTLNNLIAQKVITSIDCNNASMVIRSSSDFGPAELTRDIKCGDLTISPQKSSTQLKDLNITIRKGGEFKVNNPDDVELNNINITFEDPTMYEPRYTWHQYNLIQMYGSTYVDLRKTRSNVKHLVLESDDSNFDEIYMSLFNPGKYEVNINDGSKKIININSIRKASQIIRQPRKYLLDKPVLDLKSGAKLGSILPLMNFPDLECVEVIYNKTMLIFINERSKPARDLIERERFNHLSIPFDECPRTTDGWIVAWAIHY